MRLLFSRRQRFFQDQHLDQGAQNQQSHQTVVRAGANTRYDGPKHRNCPAMRRPIEFYHPQGADNGASMDLQMGQSRRQRVKAAAVMLVAVQAE